MTSEIDKLKHFHTGRYFNTCLLYEHDIDKECSCLKGIRLEDVTVELEEEAYKEMRNNK